MNLPTPYDDHAHRQRRVRYYRHPSWWRIQVNRTVATPVVWLAIALDWLTRGALGRTIVRWRHR